MSAVMARRVSRGVGRRVYWTRLVLADGSQLWHMRSDKKMRGRGVWGSSRRRDGQGCCQCWCGFKGVHTRRPPPELANLRDCGAGAVEGPLARDWGEKLRPHIRRGDVWTRSMEWRPNGATLVVPWWHSRLAPAVPSLQVCGLRPGGVSSRWESVNYDISRGAE